MHTEGGGKQQEPSSSDHVLGKLAEKLCGPGGGGAAVNSVATCSPQMSISFEFGAGTDFPDDVVEVSVRSETVGGAFLKCRESNPELPELNRVLCFSILNERTKKEMQVKAEYACKKPVKHYSDNAMFPNKVMKVSVLPPEDG